MRYVVYVPYLGMEHLRLIRQRWREEYCIYVDGVVAIKMVTSIATPTLSSFALGG